MPNHSRSSSVASSRSAASSHADNNQRQESDDSSSESLSDSEGNDMAITPSNRARPESYWEIKIQENEKDRETIWRPFEKVIDGDNTIFVNSRFAPVTHEALVQRFADYMSDQIPDDLIEEDVVPVGHLTQLMSLSGLYCQVYETRFIKGLEYGVRTRMRTMRHWRIKVNNPEISP